MQNKQISIIIYDIHGLECVSCDVVTPSNGRGLYGDCAQVKQGLARRCEKPGQSPFHIYGALTVVVFLITDKLFQWSHLPRKCTTAPSLSYCSCPPPFVGFLFMQNCIRERSWQLFRTPSLDHYRLQILKTQP